MPRPPRLAPQGVPLHVIQRGNNRAPCFFGDVDRRFYLKCLASSAGRTHCLVHAYVLMTNHVHLLVTPRARGSVSAMLQDLGRRYVRVVNTIHGRTGTLWEGRFRSSLVDTERYLLTCHRYIELNPVRAGLSSSPSEYPWSSHAHYAAGETNPLITAHAAYLGLGATPTERQAAFRDLFLNELDEATLARIREAVNANSPLGPAPPRKRGRPTKPLPDDGLIAMSGKLL